MNYLGLPIGSRVQNHIWSRCKESAMQSDGSRYKRERLKYKQDNIACPQSYLFSGTLIISSKNIKYTANIESALLFGNITDPNKSKQNARVYL
jgi:hypothetical protein